MVWIQAKELDDADEVIRLLGYLGWTGQRHGQYSRWAAGLSSATVGRQEEGVGRRLHGEHGRRGRADDPPHLAGRNSVYTSR